MLLEPTRSWQSPSVSNISGRVLRHWLSAAPATSRPGPVQRCALQSTPTMAITLNSSSSKALRRRLRSRLHQHVSLHARTSSQGAAFKVPFKRSPHSHLSSKESPDKLNKTAEAPVSDACAQPSVEYTPAASRVANSKLVCYKNQLSCSRWPSNRSELPSPRTPQLESALFFGADEFQI